MKYFVKFFVVTFLVLICSYASAEEKIAVVDIKYVLNNSKAGKAAQEHLKKTFSQNQKIYSAEEKKLKKEEEDLLSKKSTLSKEDYKTKSNKLREKVKKYQIERRKSFESVAKLRASAREQLLNKLDPILSAYIEENNISVILDKKFTLGGSQAVDITNLIVEKLNKDLPSLKLK